MRILVTGADGFIGSHLVELLLSEKHQVRALNYYNSFNHWGWLEGISHPNLEVVSGDIRDANFCRTITQDIEIIYHLAALIAIPYSYVAPDSYIDTNVKGTLNICQAAKEYGVKRVIVTSTSEVYGTARYVPIDEQHPKQPQSPYSASKIGADMIALSFYHSFNLPVIVARPFNTYGPRQSARAIIPTIISQIASGLTEIKVGDLSPTRDFNFVKDTCKGFMLLANCDEAVGEEVNIASNSEISMSDTLHLIAKLMHTEVTFIEDQTRLRPQNSEVFRLWGNNQKIKSLTGYTPEYSIEKGLQETIDWFLNPDHLNRYKANIYNL
jgi:NAD dependent epimerase/dehydratase